MGKNVGDIANNFDNFTSDTKSLVGKAITWSYLQLASENIQKAVRSAGVPSNQNLNAARDLIIEGINRIESLVESSRSNLKKIGVYGDIKTILSAYKTAAAAGGVAVVPKVAFAANGKMMPLVESAMSGGAESIRSIGEAFVKNPSLKSKVSSLLAGDLSTTSLRELGTWLDGADALKSEAIKAFMTKEDAEKLRTLYEYTKSLLAIKDAISSVANFASQNPGVSQAVGWGATLRRILKWLVRAVKIEPRWD